MNGGITQRYNAYQKNIASLISMTYLKRFMLIIVKKLCRISFQTLSIYCRGKKMGINGIKNIGTSSIFRDMNCQIVESHQIYLFDILSRPVHNNQLWLGPKVPFISGRTGF